MNAIKEFLFNVAIPLATDTYSPVSHANFHNFMEKEFQLN